MLMPDLHSAARALEGEVKGGQVLFPPPGHSRDDRSACLKFDPAAPEGFVVHSFAGDDPLPIRDHVKERIGMAHRVLDFNSTRLRNKNAEARAPRARIVAEYIYKRPDGTPYLKVGRTDPKGSFPQWHWTGSRWELGKPKGPKIPYRLPELLAAVHDVVFVVEGEKDANRLTDLGFVATTASEGAGKWTADLNPYFKGKTVYVLADNDDAGRNHARQVAENLTGTAASVRIVALPGIPEKGDVSDWLDAGNDPGGLVPLCAKEPEWKPGEAEKPESKALPFTAFDDIQVEVKKPWVLKGIIARGETSSWFGGPGKGKSALLTDIAVHVASGLDWRGHRSKERCAVVILAFERADLMLRRLDAYKRKRELQNLPVVVIRASVDILKPESVEILTDTIRAVEQRFNLPVGLLILDTYSKALALGGGDENAAKDVNRFLGHLRGAQGQTNVHVALIGHSGKDESRGHRGSNAHLGDVDVEVKIGGDLVKSATIEKANDQADGPLTDFKLETFSFGLDEDGDEITTSIVSGEVPKDQAESSDEPKLSKNQRTMFALLHGAGPKGLTTEEWNEKAREAGLGVSRKADLYDFRQSLKSKNLVRQFGDRWTVALC